MALTYFCGDVWVAACRKRFLTTGTEWTGAGSGLKRTGLHSFQALVVLSCDLPHL